MTLSNIKPMFNIPMGKFIVGDLPTKEEMLNGTPLGSCWGGRSYGTQPRTINHWFSYQLIKAHEQIYLTDPDTIERYNAVAVYFRRVGFDVKYDGITPPVIYWVDYEGDLGDMAKTIKDCLSGPKRPINTTPLITEDAYQKMRDTVNNKKNFITIDSFTEM